ncbi:ankyrin-2-like [Aplysia californica]|uniref:Ankyrin-2-like n=1 Tax=Aplysia californica TaxID=6500 RepID=A0ABM1AEY2_APLCA|nr:ankyrin-2-like [Aplysia californica]
MDRMSANSKCISRSPAGPARRRSQRIARSTWRNDSAVDPARQTSLSSAPSFSAYSKKYGLRSSESKTKIQQMPGNSSGKRKQSSLVSDLETPPTKNLRTSKQATSETVADSSRAGPSQFVSVNARKKLQSNSKPSPAVKLSSDLVDAVIAGQSRKVAKILKALGHTDTTGIPFQWVKDTCLYEAVFRGNLLMVQTLIYNGADVSFEQHGRNCLRLAVKRGYVDIVEFLLSYLSRNMIKERIIEGTDRCGNTLLILCQRSNAAAHFTKILLSEGAAVNTQNKEGETALMKAVRSQNLKSVLYLLKAGANVELKNKKGKTARSLAAAMGMKGLIDILGPDSSEQALSPLMRAAKAQKMTLLELLLISRMFEVNGEELGDETKKDTALSMIFNSKWKNGPVQLTGTRRDSEYLKSGFLPFTVKEREVIAILVKGGVSIHTGGRFTVWNSPFLTVLRLGDYNLLNIFIQGQKWIGNGASYAKALEIAATDGRCDLIDLLTPAVKSLSILFDVRAVWGEDFQQALHAVLRVGSRQCVYRILDLVQDIIDFTQAMSTAANSGRYSIFMLLRNAFPKKFELLISRDEGTEWLSHACLGNCFTIVNSLLKSGAAPNGKLTLDQPLICSKSAMVSELLLQYGADVNRPCLLLDPLDGTFHETTALWRAVVSNSINIVRVLKKHGATTDISLVNITLLGDFCSRKMQRLILNFDFDPNQADRQGILPIWVAASRDDVESLETLIKKGADVDLKTFSSPPALVTGAESKSPEVIRCLLSHGADVDNTDVDGDTPLIVAAVSDDGTIIRMLREKGAQLNATNCTGRTALMVAYNAKNLAAFYCLLDLGADLNVKENGETLLSRSLRERQVDPLYVQALLMHGGKVSSREALFAVHNCIATKQLGVLSTLIHCGGFIPTLLNEHSPFCRAQFPLVSACADVFSPLCMALLCNRVEIARDMLKAFFLTASDLTLLPRHKKVRELLNGRGYLESLQVLDEMSSSPPSLKLLCFVQVSDLCGPVPGRRERVAQLELPVCLKESLMFTANDQSIGRKCCCLVEDPSELQIGSYAGDGYSIWGRDEMRDPFVLS